MAEMSKAWTRGWKRGLKTLSYYSRTKSATDAQKAQVEKKEIKEEAENLVCTRDCLSCGS